jgi:hypothetical protein
LTVHYSLFIKGLPPAFAAQRDRRTSEAFFHWKKPDKQNIIAAQKQGTKNIHSLCMLYVKPNKIVKRNCAEDLQKINRPA